MFCPNCGKEVTKDLKYCEYCGHRLKSEKRNIPQNEREAIRVTHVFPVIALLGIILLIIFLFVLRRNHKKGTDRYVMQNEDKTYTLSEYLQTGPTVWLQIYTPEPTIGKDTWVDRHEYDYRDLAILYPDGTCLGVDLNEENTLGEFAQLSADEIIEKVKTEGEITEGQYRVIIETDSTGNYTEYEKIVFNYDDYKEKSMDEEGNVMQTFYSIFLFKAAWELKVQEPNLINVYDAWFTGYTWQQQLIQTYTHGVITRVPDSSTFLVYDEVGTADIPVDVPESEYPNLF